MQLPIQNQYVFFMEKWNHKDAFTIKDPNLLHQLQRVLQREDGDVIWFVNGRGERLKVVIQYMNKHEIICEPLGIEYINPLDYSIHLAVGTPKKESWKDILKYTTQLGVSSITLIDSEYSQYKTKRYWDKLPYYQNIIKESLEQSLQPYMPELYQCESWNQFLLSTTSYVCVADIEASAYHLPTLLEHNSHLRDWIFCIGPEGGWSPQEREVFQEHQISVFQLSNNILRVETAVITSVAIAQSILSARTPKK